MVRDTTSGSFYFTSLLCCSVPLRMTGLGDFARAICFCVMLAGAGDAPVRCRLPMRPKAAFDASSAIPSQVPAIPRLPLSLRQRSCNRPTDNALHPPGPTDEIVVTAVGDVMLGTTFPDESTLPPNDGADLLTKVTPFLKRGDVVYGIWKARLSMAVIQPSATERR